jgi:hypothetical protein
MHKDVQQETESTMVQSNLYIKMGDDESPDKIITVDVMSNMRDFEILFKLSEFPDIRLLKWVPVENRICNVYIDNIFLRTSEGKEFFFPLENISYRGDRISFHEFMIFSIIEGIELPFNEKTQLQEVVFRGRWYIRDQDETRIYLLERKVMHLSSLNCDLIKKNDDLEQKNTDLGIKNSDLELKNTDLGIKNSDLELKNTDLGIKNSDLELKNTDLGIKNSDLELKNTDLGIKNKDLELKILNLKVRSLKKTRNSKRRLRILIFLNER